MSTPLIQAATLSPDDPNLALLISNGIVYEVDLRQKAVVAPPIPVSQRFPALAGRPIDSAYGSPAEGFASVINSGTDALAVLKGETPTSPQVPLAPIDVEPGQLAPPYNAAFSDKASANLFNGTQVSYSDPEDGRTTGPVLGSVLPPEFDTVDEYLYDPGNQELYAFSGTRFSTRSWSPGGAQSLFDLAGQAYWRPAAQIGGPDGFAMFPDPEASRPHARRGLDSLLAQKQGLIDEVSVLLKSLVSAHGPLMRTLAGGVGYWWSSYNKADLDALSRTSEYSAIHQLLNQGDVHSWSFAIGGQGGYVFEGSYYSGFAFSTQPDRTFIDFVSLGLGAGFEAGGHTGLQFQINFFDIGDVAGFMYGLAATVVPVAGASVGAMYTKSQQLAVVIDVGIGLDIGLSLDTSYTWELTRGRVGG